MELDENCPVGYSLNPESTDLILWLEHAGTKALEIGIAPES